MKKILINDQEISADEIEVRVFQGKIQIELKSKQNLFNNIITKGIFYFPVEDQKNLFITNKEYQLYSKEISYLGEKDQEKKYILIYERENA